jgi:hypothetical protein
LQRPRTDIFLERRVDARFDGSRDLARPSAPGEQAAELDDAQAADGRGRLLPDERLELFGERLVEIPLRQSTGVEIRPH